MDFERYTSLGDRTKARSNDHQVIKYAHTYVVEKEGKEGNPPVFLPKSAASLGLTRNSSNAEYAIVSTTRINAKGEDEGVKSKIQSETMQQALRSVFGKHPPVGLYANPIAFKRPYYPLFHCWREIREMAEREFNTEQQNRHLKWLTEFMSENLQTLQKVQESLVDKGLVDFEHLAIIFEPGSLVIGRISDHQNRRVKIDMAVKTVQRECFLFDEISDEQENKETGAKYKEIQAFRWGYNDSMFGLTPVILRIYQFQGPRKITELECFPLKHLKEEETNEIVPNMIDRGEKWLENVEARNFYYKGVAQVPRRPKFSNETIVIPIYMPGRVVLDHPAFVEEFPELRTPLHHRVSDYGEKIVQAGEQSFEPGDEWRLSSCMTLPRGNLWRCHEKKDYRPTKAQQLLCPALSPGYSVEQKDWGYFDTDRLKDIEWLPNPIQELEIKPRWKELLRDLMMEHQSKVFPNGIASGKGEGRVFLLHGPPGCGKTRTAELMAEEGKRALLRISGGDLGDRPSELETKLQARLKLALRVSAIVLIDEADTFLAKRINGGGSGAYYHNTIVSIFLRYLEHFPGVIFLTTNQETDIDEAVNSRVISLRYPPLNAKGRANIWEKQLLRGGDIPKEQVRSLSEDLGNAYELDGREIKTLADLSLAVGRQRSQTLSKDIIEDMYDLTHGTK